METQLRELIGVELRRRHAIGLMESKIKPVHIANALMREEHGVVGRMADLRHLMTATAAKETPDRQEEAARRLIERSRERWGRLADEPNLKKSVLMTKVLPSCAPSSAQTVRRLARRPRCRHFPRRPP